MTHPRPRLRRRKRRKRRLKKILILVVACSSMMSTEHTYYHSSKTYLHPGSPNNYNNPADVSTEFICISPEILSAKSTQLSKTGPYASHVNHLAFIMSES